MTSRRTTVLGLVVLAGCVLVPGGAILLFQGSTTDHSGESVVGILALVLGLACLRVLFWVRRARLLTRAGLSLHHPEDPPGPAPPDDPAVR